MQMTVNGIAVNYTDEGRGVPLLFVHGFPLSRGVWQKQLEALRSSYRVIAPISADSAEAKPGLAQRRWRNSRGIFMRCSNNSPPDRWC